MKTRGILGKRIVAIEQTRVHQGKGYEGSTMALQHIELEGGLRLIPITKTTDNDYLTDFLVVGPRRARPKPAPSEQKQLDLG